MCIITNGIQTFLETVKMWMLTPQIYEIFFKSIRKKYIQYVCLLKRMELFYNKVS